MSPFRITLLLRGCRKTPICGVTFISRHCGVLLCTPHSSGFVRASLGLPTLRAGPQFRKPCIWTFSISLKEAEFSIFSKRFLRDAKLISLLGERRSHDPWKLQMRRALYLGTSCVSEDSASATSNISDANRASSMAGAIRRLKFIRRARSSLRNP
jgi:hypothetical protein